MTWFKVVLTIWIVLQPVAVIAFINSRGRTLGDDILLMGIHTAGLTFIITGIWSWL